MRLAHWQFNKSNIFNTGGRIETTVAFNSTRYLNPDLLKKAEIGAKDVNKLNVSINYLIGQWKIAGGFNIDTAGNDAFIFNAKIARDVLLNGSKFTISTGMQSFRGLDASKSFVVYHPLMGNFTIQARF